MNAIANTPRRAIEWPAPVIADPTEALADARASLTRVLTLFTKNNDDLLEILSQEQIGIWHLYLLAEGELRALDVVLEQIIDFKVQPATSFGKHVDIRQRHDWAEAAREYLYAEACPVGSPDGTVAAEAFQRVLRTRAPNLRCLHEKLMIIEKADGWGVDGTADAVITDVEHLGRKFEIAGSNAVQAEG